VLNHGLVGMAFDRRSPTALRTTCASGGKESDGSSASSRSGPKAESLKTRRDMCSSASSLIHTENCTLHGGVPATRVILRREYEGDQIREGMNAWATAFTDIEAGTELEENTALPPDGFHIAASAS
jgi:hypothetical protein